MAKLQQVHVVQEFNFPVETLFALLSEHENLSKIFFPAKVTRIKDGNTSRNGAGSARRMQIPLTPSFVETTLVFKENEQIEYAITDGIAPITNHYGVMKFIDLGNNRSKLDYTIEFKGILPGVGPVVKALLQDGITRGLKKLKP